MSKPKTASQNRVPSATMTVETYRSPEKYPDYSIWIGLTFLSLLILVALSLSGSIAAFADFRSFLLVICGTLAIMGLSFSGKNLKESIKALREHLFEKPESPRARARNLMDVAMIARRDGILKFQNIQGRLARRDPFLANGLQMIADNQSPAEISRLLNQEIDVEVERLQGAIALFRRGAEAAPAMGLIGTLIGLVQMLSALDDPGTIGPAMAVALLTTFYGALMGSAFFAPLAGKLELQTKNLILRYELVIITMLSVMAHENPRKLEQMLNSKLPAGERINYFSDV